MRTTGWMAGIPLPGGRSGGCLFTADPQLRRDDGGTAISTKTFVVLELLDHFRSAERVVFAFRDARKFEIVDALDLVRLTWGMQDDVGLHRPLPLVRQSVSS